MNLARVSIPNSVTKIESQVFSGCVKLDQVTIPSSVKTIESYAFQGCAGLTNITIPNSVASIGYKAFSQCASLTNILIPDQVTALPDHVFFGAVRACGVSPSPSVVTAIGAYTFSDCVSLKSVTVPKAVVSLGDYVFSGCSNLVSFSATNSLTSIGAGAFLGLRAPAPDHAPPIPRRRGEPRVPGVRPTGQRHPVHEGQQPGRLCLFGLRQPDQYQHPRQCLEYREERLFPAASIWPPSPFPAASAAWGMRFSPTARA